MTRGPGRRKKEFTSDELQARALRRREACRRNQRRYLQRQQDRFVALTKITDFLRQQNDFYQEYCDGLKSGKPESTKDFRVKQADVYARAFQQLQAVPSSTLKLEQEAITRNYFAPAVVFHNLKKVQSRHASCLLREWVFLKDQLPRRVVQVEQTTPITKDGDLCEISYVCTVPLDDDFIAFCSHCKLQIEKQVWSDIKGKQLQYEVKEIVAFGSDNKINRIETSSTLMHAWTNLRPNDSEFLVQVLDLNLESEARLQTKS